MDTNKREYGTVIRVNSRFDLGASGGSSRVNQKMNVLRQNVGNILDNATPK